MVLVEGPSDVEIARQKLEALERAAWRAGIIGSLQGAIAVASARILLLFVCIGAFVLAWRALATGNPMALIAAACYDVGVVLPAVWVALRGR